MPETTLYALLVGINEYQSEQVPALRGCINDVNAVEQLLTDRFQVPPQNIQKLINQEATHQAIKDAFQSHLIDTAAQGQTEAAYLFYYCGHGSQAIDQTGSEPDGKDETLVPYDSRTEGVFDIKDWEIGQMLDRLTAHAKNVTVILDCCHSGSGTRDILLETGEVRTRDCAADERPQPAWSQRPANLPQTRSASPSGWRLSEDYVLLAACRDREKAKEMRAKTGDDFRQHGALTYFLVETIAGLPAGQAPTYRELHERVRDKIQAANIPDQVPQCEGQRDRPLFGGLSIARDPFLNLTRDAQGKLTVEAGLAHGLRLGTILEVYPPETHLSDEAGEPLARIELTGVGAVRSTFKVLDGQSDLPDNARAVVALGMMQRPVRLNLRDETLRAAVETRLAEEDVAPYVTLAGPGWAFDFQIAAPTGNLEIQDNAGTLLVQPFAPDSLASLGADLAHLVRYANTRDLANTAPNSTLAEAVELKFRLFKTGEIDEAGHPLLEDLAPAPDGKLVLETDQEFVIELKNNHHHPLHVALFELGYEWDIVQWHPREGAHEQLAPGAVFRIGYQADDRIAFGLDETIREVRETFKLIVTQDDADFETLQQGTLKTPFSRSADGTRSITSDNSPLTQLMRLSMTGGTRGSLRRKSSPTANEWTTAQLEVTITQPLNGREVRGGLITELPGFDLKIEPPADFLGAAQVLTADQGGRAAEGDTTDLQSPPGLAEFGDIFAPLPLGASRTVGPGGAVIELEAEDQRRALISEQTPLKLHLPAEAVGQNEAVIALAYDGNLYYPVGRPGDTAHTLHIEWLPQSAPPDERALHTRSLGRTLKLYLYKTVLGWEEAGLGLHRARFVPQADLERDLAAADEHAYAVRGGEVRYRKLKAAEIRAGDRVVLFVHGFQSDSRYMVSGPIPWLQQQGHRYDHFLTFDYETYGTPIKENGRDLFNALAGAGFSAGDEVHLDVFAHSMGTQVCRSMIEQHGGAAFVDRYFMAGPPNAGTRLAEAKRLVTWVGTLLLNQAGPTPPALLASWALKKASDDGLGANDLRPSSPFYRELNSQNKPAHIPYYILAGHNQIDDAAERSIWQRIVKQLEEGVDTVADFLFSGQNDLVIGVRSMKSLTGEGVEANDVDCDHFGYFDTPSARAALLDWLGQDSS